MRRFFSRSRSAQDVQQSPPRSMSRSVSDPSMSPSTSRDYSSSPEVWRAPAAKPRSAVQRKIKDEKDLCRKYQSCDDYEKLKREYLKSFCRTWSTQERKELENFLDFAKEEQLVRAETTLADIRALCSLYENTV